MLRKVGQGEKFSKLVPAYPRVYNSWDCDRVLTLGLQVPDKALWNKKLMEINGRLGARKQVNIILVFVNSEDSSYIHALEEKWLGGKKNDLVLIVGATQYPKIDWVRIMSWSRSEDLKVELRDGMMNLNTLDKRDEVLTLIEQQVDQKFVRTPMAQFEYLLASWQPSTGVLVTLFVLGILGSVGMTIYFFQADPFETGDRRFRSW